MSVQVGLEVVSLVAHCAPELLRFVRRFVDLEQLRAGKSHRARLTSELLLSFVNFVEMDTQCIRV